MGAAAVTLSVRLVAVYAGLNCLPLQMARPLIVANWPVREPKVITWKLFPMAGLKPFTRARLSIPSSVAAPEMVNRLKQLVAVPPMSMTQFRLRDYGSVPAVSSNLLARDGPQFR